MKRQSKREVSIVKDFWKSRETFDLKDASLNISNLLASSGKKKFQQTTRGKREKPEKGIQC